MYKNLSSAFIRRIQVSSLLAVLTILSLLFLTASDIMAFPPQNRVTVMSRNLYVGADIFRIIEAANNPEQGELSISMAVAEVFQTVQYTNFLERVQTIVDEIQRYRPHLIGLQEVATILQQIPGDFLIGNPHPASDVVYDYQKILLEALATHKLEYKVAALVTNADVELPMLAGFDENDGPVFHDIRLIDHDIILVRKDVSYENPLAQNYHTNISLPIAGVMAEFKRGYTSIDAQIKDSNFHFVNTHLEVSGGEDNVFSAVQSAQTAELLNIINAKGEPVILLGDFNSSPEDMIIENDIFGQIVPPYSQVIAAGYADLATRSKKYPDFTCCFNETLDDPLASLYERVDHIFFLPHDFMEIPQTKFKVIGDKQKEMTASGLWPSDHAGVIGIIKF
jgi:endonuclease/exonuclease/phosphatase family metal-dependent hydrolase